MFLIFHQLNRLLRYSNHGETIFNKKLQLKNLIISIIYKYLWYLKFLALFFQFNQVFKSDSDFIQIARPKAELMSRPKAELHFAYLDTTAQPSQSSSCRAKRGKMLVLYNKAVFYQSLFDWNRALEAYADLHKINPFHTSGHYNLGFIHMELGLHNVATNNFSDAIYSNSIFNKLRQHYTLDSAHLITVIADFQCR